MRVVIVPLDGSMLAEQAVALGEELAHTLGASLALVHVLESLPAVSGGMDRAAAGTYLAGMARLLGERVPIETRILSGDPAQALLALSHEPSESMIVMSTRGRSGVGRFIFGSVTDRVIRAASVPVTVLRQPERDGDVTLRHLLVPLDGSELAEAALPLAVELARQRGATIGLVRVAEIYPVGPYGGHSTETLPPDDGLLAELTEQARDDARSYLDGIVGELRDRGARAVWEVRVGRPVDEIIRAAETTAADLVIMSTHGRGGIQRWAFGSVTDEVLRSGVAPVMVIPPGMRAADQDVVIGSGSARPPSPGHDW